MDRIYQEIIAGTNPKAKRIYFPMIILPHRPANDAFTRLMKIRFEITALSTILIASLLLSIWLFNYRFHGYYSYHGDDEVRSLISYAVYRGDNFPVGSQIFNIKPQGFFPHWIWLPFQFWFNAALLGIIRNPRLVSFVSNSFFSTGTAIIIYLLTKLISGNRKAAAAGGMLWYLSLPLFRELNISGLDLPILHFFVLAGIYFWLRVVSSSRGVIFFWPAAICFLLASTVRYEGWFFVGAFELAIFLRLIFRGSWANWLQGALILVIPLVFIASWMLDQQLRYGDLFFLTFYRREALGGIQQLFGQYSWHFKAFIYPRMAIQSSPLIVILAPLAFLTWPRQGRLALQYTGFIAIGLVILSSATIYGGVPNAPERIAYILLLLLLPLAATGVWTLVGFIAKKLKKNVSLVALGPLFFGGIAVYYLAATPTSLNNSMTEEIARIGGILEWSTGRGIITEKERIVFEERTLLDGVDGRWGRWDSIRLTLFAPDQMISDRYQKVTIKNGKEYTDPENLSSSFFRRRSGDSLRDYLEDHNIKIAIVWSLETKSKLEKILIPAFSTSHYTIFISPDKAWTLESRWGLPSW